MPTDQVIATWRAELAVLESTRLKLLSRDKQVVRVQFPDAHVVSYTLTNISHLAARINELKELLLPIDHPEDDICSFRAVGVKNL